MMKTNSFYCLVLGLLTILLVSASSATLAFAPLQTSPTRGRYAREHGFGINRRLSLINNAVGDFSGHMEQVLLVECGFGNDSHGQNATKAGIRACRNAIEFNSVRVTKIIPGGYYVMKLNVILAVPSKYQEGLDLNAVAEVFPFGDVRFEVQDGGMIAPSGRTIVELGDKNDDMVIVCAAVQVGY